MPRECCRPGKDVYRVEGQQSKRPVNTGNKLPGVKMWICRKRRSDYWSMAILTAEQAVACAHIDRKDRAEDEKYEGDDFEFPRPPGFPWG